MTACVIDRVLFVRPSKKNWRQSILTGNSKGEREPRWEEEEERSRRGAEAQGRKLCWNEKTQRQVTVAEDDERKPMLKRRWATRRKSRRIYHWLSILYCLKLRKVSNIDSTWIAIRFCHYAILIPLYTVQCPRIKVEEEEKEEKEEKHRQHGKDNSRWERRQAVQIADNQILILALWHNVPI